MKDDVKEVLSRQAVAPIEMLRNAIEACDEKLWDNGSNFWYQAYHTLFFLDYYYSEEPNKFHPPAPFTMSEMDPSGLMPERTYTREELLTYAEFCRKKCLDRIKGITEASLMSPVATYSRNWPLFEIILFNMRHVQHHTAQLNLLIRQFGGEPAKWV